MTVNAKHTINVLSRGCSLSLRILPLFYSVYADVRNFDDDAASLKGGSRCHRQQPPRAPCMTKVIAIEPSVNTDIYIYNVLFFCNKVHRLIMYLLDAHVCVRARAILELECSFAL